MARGFARAASKTSTMGPTDNCYGGLAKDPEAAKVGAGRGLSDRAGGDFPTGEESPDTVRQHAA